MIPLYDTESLKKFPFWVFLIILVNIYVFYLEISVPSFDHFISRFSLIPAAVNFGNLATLTPFITSQFIHGGFLHIISNMLFLWVFGRNVEAKIGEVLFPIIYLSTGVIGGLAQYFLNPYSTIPTLGASGAIAGILGMYYIFFPGHKIKTILIIFIFITLFDIPAWIMLFYWFLTQVLSASFTLSQTASQGGIAYIAHVVGFLTGIITSEILLFTPRREIAKA